METTGEYTRALRGPDGRAVDRARRASFTEGLVHAAAWLLPDDRRDECREEWLAELPAVRTDPEVGSPARRGIRTLAFAASLACSPRNLAVAAVLALQGVTAVLGIRFLLAYGAMMRAANPHPSKETYAVCGPDGCTAVPANWTVPPGALPVFAAACACGAAAVGCGFLLYYLYIRFRRRPA